MKVVRLSVSRTDRLYPQKCPWYSFSLQAESNPGRNMSLKNPVTPPETDPGTVRLEAQHLNNYATPSPYQYIYVHIHIVMDIDMYDYIDAN
jgi:hypothetical protein